MRWTPGHAIPQSIRPAEPQDIETLQRLYGQADAAWLPAEARGRHDFAEASKGERVFVCCDPEGNIIGFVSVYPQESFVHHLYVSPAHLRRRVGTALLDSLQSWLPMPWRLKCVTANASAMRFYEARGWTVEGHGTGPDGPYALFRKDEARHRSDR